MDYGTGRSGRPLRPLVAARVIAVLADPQNDRLSQKALARLAQIGLRTWRDCLTPLILAEVEARRTRQISPDMLPEVDRAMLAKAREGNVAAARLVYMRVAGLKDPSEPEETPSLEELEAELGRLKGHET